ncbi:MAG: signal recognition particle-docking protein FtsY, partial [Verrucomicrobiae bacterium]|nr:signal recognition particle-docking protein FtsY [Verrucomicrobiae bacterium]
MSFFDKLKAGLANARDHIKAQFVGPEINYETLERTLLSADFGIPMTQQIIDSVHREAMDRPTLARENAMAIVRSEIEKVLLPRPRANGHAARPRVVLVIGVNGTGKTTSIAKIAHYFHRQGQKVLLAAADTFRAAAIDQLKIWSDRLKLPLVEAPYGSDPASVAHQAVSRAKAEGFDIVLVDTAGRLHNKENLMRELEKIHRVVAKQAGADPEIWLVLDATTGNNALPQAREFNNVLGLDGLVVTKLDG